MEECLKCKQPIKYPSRYGICPPCKERPCAKCGKIVRFHKPETTLCPTCARHLAVKKARAGALE